MFNLNYEGLVSSWNETLVTLAKITNVPVALVMRVENGNIAVFSRNNSESNPYQIGDSEDLVGSGLYCEYVINNQQALKVPNAFKEPDWSNNPDIKLNMIAYLGLPIVESTGKPFGTVCILDSKENHFSEETLDLLVTIKRNFEMQLNLLYQQHTLFEKQQYDELAILIKGLSHEVNTPLGVGVTTVGVIDSHLSKVDTQLADKSLSPLTLKQELDSIRESTSLLNNSLATASKKINLLQSLLIDDFSFQPKLIDIQQSVQESVHLFMASNKNEGVNVTVEFEDMTESQLNINPSKLNEIISVLLTNAVEHGFESENLNTGQVQVRVSTAFQCFLLEVSDNGVGIRKGAETHIFEPFFTTSRHKGSAGLGLSMIKYLITQRMGGKIELANTSLGTAFLVTLPM